MTLLSATITAYLEPLLKKHDAGEALIWEDLIASEAASKVVLKNSGNIFVSKKLNDLHTSQVQAYREAAVKALKDWVQTEATLEPMEEGDTETDFVQRCCAAVASGTLLIPAWHGLDSREMVVTMEIRKRARAVYAKYHPPSSPLTTEDDEQATELAGESETGDQEVGDAEGEDGEMEEVEGDTVDPLQTTKDGENNKNNNNSNGTRKVSESTGGAKKKMPAGIAAKKQNKKKVAVRKKGTTAKQMNNGLQQSQTPSQQGRGKPSNRGGRRGGRGGGTTKSG